MECAQQADVVILGGGAAGCATALALARHGAFGILIIEAGRYDATRTGESIMPDACIPLERLGIWDEFRTEGHAACFGSCSSWGSEAIGYNDFLMSPFGNGWHLDRRRFDCFLARKASERATLLTGARFEGCRHLPDGRMLVRFSRENGKPEQVAARFVVDATGLRSAFSRSVGARRRFVDHLLCAVGIVECADSAFRSGLTMLEAVDYGWWYAAQVPHDRFIVAVASDPEIFRRLRLGTRDGWIERLGDAARISTALDGHIPLGCDPIAAPAPSCVLDRIAGDNWLAVGDAASMYDPISSQGLYKALSDGVLAGAAIASFLRGDRQAIDGYQAAVRAAFRKYLKGRSHFYGLERRWPASAFWSSRHVSPGEAAIRSL